MSGCVCGVCFVAGTLEDYEQAYSKCEAQLARVNERKAKVGTLVQWLM